MSLESIFSAEPAPVDPAVQSPAPATDPASTPVLGQDKANPAPVVPEAGGLKTEDGKAKEKPATTPVNYEFKAPDGGELDAAAVEAFVPLAQEMNLSQEQAQKLVDFYTSRIANQQVNQQAAQQKALAALQDQWEADTRKDPDIGGAGLAGNLAIAAKALDTFGGPALREMLSVTGVGSHPEMVKFAIKIGKAIAEDGFISGKPGAGAKSAAEVLYPNHK